MYIFHSTSDQCECMLQPDHIWKNYLGWVSIDLHALPRLSLSVWLWPALFLCWPQEMEHYATMCLPRVIKMPSLSKTGTSVLADQRGPVVGGGDDNCTLIKKPFIGVKGQLKA